MLSKNSFAKHVTVWASSGRFLFRCHAEEALRLIAEGTAEPDTDDRPKKRGIGRLILLSTPQGKTGPASAVTPASYRQTTVYKERLGSSEYEGWWTYALLPQERPLQVLEVIEVNA